MSPDAPLRVLVVDDDALMVQLLSRLLVRAGTPAPASASDGRAALEALDAADVDVIFCDIDMPGMDGVEFLRHLRMRPSPPAVVVLSSTPDIIRESVESLGVAHQLRILGSLPKPATLDAVQDMLARARLEPVARAADLGYLTLSPSDVLGLLATGVEVHYQTLHHAQTLEVYGVEALARLRHPTYGLVGPNIFVPICEQAGAATQLLRAVLRQALPLLVEIGDPNLHVAVNLSSADLTSPDLVGELSGLIEASGLEPDRLILELTENRALHDTTLPIEILTRLRVRRMGLAVDDFGTGYASLKQLRNIPFSELKIDQSFVRGAHADERRRTMLASTIELARELQLTTVAEGVETEAELALLRGLGCDLVQGYLFSRPLPADQLRAFLADRSGPTPTTPEPEIR